MLALVRDRMESGCLTDESYMLITFTYHMGYESQRDAACVKEDWTALLRLWKRSCPNLRWFKVVEATKKGQPHLHLLVSGIGDRVADCKHDRGECRHPRTARWAWSVCRVNCLEHELSKYWNDITGDSWIVDARPGFGVRGASAYLTKYMAKGFEEFARLTELGFKRRYSTSRNWPRPDKLQLANTGREVWDNSKTERIYTRDGTAQTYAIAAIRDASSPLSARVGTPVAFAKAKRLSNKRQLAIIRSFHETDRATHVASNSDRGIGSSNGRLSTAGRRET